MKALLRRESLGVLCTAREGRPHASLMAYVVDDRAETLFMATRPGTRKYDNLKANPAVSVLVDDRRSGAGRIMALTVFGKYEPVVDPDLRRTWLDRLVERHPALAGLAEQPDLEVFAIQAESFLLLDGPEAASFEEL